jgi:hypothetical protein
MPVPTQWPDYGLPDDQIVQQLTESFKKYPNIPTLAPVQQRLHPGVLLHPFSFSLCPLSERAFAMHRVEVTLSWLVAAAYRYHYQAR